MKFGGCLQSSENPTKAIPYEGKVKQILSTQRHLC